MNKYVQLNDITPEDLKGQFLTIQEVADIFNVTTKTIWLWQKEKKLKCIRVGNAVRFSKPYIIRML